VQRSPCIAIASTSFLASSPTEVEIMKGIFGSAGRDEFPSSEQDARSHIRKIRLDRGADEVTGDLQVGPNIEDLQAALKV
jgi:hypothetical protein